MTPEIEKRIKAVQAGRVPAGYKRTAGGIVPNEWEETPLEKCLVEYKEKTTKPNQYPMLTSARAALMLQSDYYSGHQVTTDDNVGYNVLPRGYVTFRSRSDDGRFKFNENNIIDKGIISYFYPVFSFNNHVDHKYMLFLLNETIYRQMFPYNEGTAQMVLSFNKLKSLQYSIPPLSEQKKIAEILATQDRVIELKEKLIAEKQSQKKYLMQTYLMKKKHSPLFQKKWKRIYLSEILKERRECNELENLRICSVAVNNGVVDQKEHLGKSMAAENTSNYAVVHYGDIVYTKSPTGAFPYGIIKQSQLKEDVAVSPLYGVYEPYCYEIGYLLQVYFSYANNANNYLKPIVNKGAKNTILISNQTFLKPSLYLPIDIEEIKYLYMLFKSTDEEISLLQKDLEQERLKKKSLMQLLLTGLVRVKV